MVGIKMAMWRLPVIFRILLLGWGKIAGYDRVIKKTPPE